MRLKLEKRIELKGKEASLTAKAISDVIKEFTMRAQVKKLKKLRIFVTTNPVETCRKIVISKIRLNRHGEMREWICENAPSFSYWEEGQIPTIMLDANERIFKQRNYSAIKGLFAHELMHLMNKLDGIEGQLEIETEKAARYIFFLLSRHKDIKPFTRDGLLSSLMRITTSVLLLIKDILANTRAMSFGFDDELYEHYRVSLADVKKEIKFTERGILKVLKQNRKHALDDAFLAYLGLNACWITFKMFHNIWYKDLQNLTKIEAPTIIKKNCDLILKEMLKLRSASDEKQIAKVIRLTQQNYYKVVRYFCEKLR
ncbi:MAG: hypothetical protein QMD36_05455 [Candidatus Aenigmarchaeota archaeon]|nr:hypothetical protein [Candidatus Aenigmarchaeota archaeon]